LATPASGTSTARGGVLRENARFNRDKNPVVGYRVALIAYAAKHHLHLPHWVHTIGGK
jgi:hypothetical protein